MIHALFWDLCLKKQNVPKKSLNEVQNLFLTLKNLSLRRVKSLKVIFQKDWGLGQVQTNRISDRVTRETDTFRSICKVIVFRLHIKLYIPHSHHRTVSLWKESLSFLSCHSLLFDICLV